MIAYILLNLANRGGGEVVTDDMEAVADEGVVPEDHHMVRYIHKLFVAFSLSKTIKIVNKKGWATT